VPEPLYTAENCKPSFQLLWTLAVWASLWRLFLLSSVLGPEHEIYPVLFVRFEGNPQYAFMGGALQSAESGLVGRQMLLTAPVTGLSAARARSLLESDGSALRPDPAPLLSLPRT